MIFHTPDGYLRQAFFITPSPAPPRATAAATRVYYGAGEVSDTFGHPERAAPRVYFCFFTRLTSIPPIHTVAFSVFSCVASRTQRVF